MTINNFKVGTLVENNEWGDGKVVANNGHRMVIEFINKIIWHYVGSPLALLQLKIKQPISKMETIKEETMQEFEPITKDNIDSVLEYNGWKRNKIYDLDWGIDYNDDIRLKISFNNNLFHFDSDMYNQNSDRICTKNFDTFLTFVQDNIKLKPISKKLRRKLCKNLSR